MIVAQPKTKIGPRHHGVRMSLRAFEFADVEPGCFVELARGYIVVSEIANYFHMRQIDIIMDYLRAYKVAVPGVIHVIGEGSSSKLLIPAWESERHPDIAIYLSPPKGKRDRTMWRDWVLEIIVEVVSPSSDDRDYTEKRDEYWALGAKEYWIVDAKRRQIIKHGRGRARWKETILGAGDVCESKLLPGFRLPCDPVFAIGADAGES